MNKIEIQLVVNGLIFLSNLLEAHNMALKDVIARREAARAEGRELGDSDMDDLAARAQAAIDRIPNG